jgi:thiol-disulfide isomerase/thioredoxin
MTMSARMCLLLVWSVCLSANAGLPAGPAAGKQPPAQSAPAPERGTPAPARATLLDVGAPAPPIKASAWLNGAPLAVNEPGKPTVYVVTFWATWSGPSRGALEDLVKLHDKHGGKGVTLVGITDEAIEPVRTFLAEARPTIPFAVALDDRGMTMRAYCEAAGVAFLPYAFVIGPDRTIAWHGHPQQPELAATVEALLADRYDRAQAQELVRKARSADQLEALFRDAYANESWDTALLAVNALLEMDVPKERLWRYKLTLLLGELDDMPGF